LAFHITAGEIKIRFYGQKKSLSIWIKNRRSILTRTKKGKKKRLLVGERKWKKKAGFFRGKNRVFSIPTSIIWTPAWGICKPPLHFLAPSGALGLWFVVPEAVRSKKMQRGFADSPCWSSNYRCWYRKHSIFTSEETRFLLSLSFAYKWTLFFPFTLRVNMERRFFSLNKTRLFCSVTPNFYLLPGNMKYQFLVFRRKKTWCSYIFFVFDFIHET
jgi:hypothetical protein